MNKITIILAGVAAYLYSSMLSTQQKLQQQVQSYVDDLEDYKEIQQAEKDATAAASDITKQIEVVGFCGVIGNYYTSDYLVSAEWYIKFKNKSNDNLRVNLNSVCVTILNSAQIWGMERFKQGSVIVAPNSTTDWIRIAHFNDGKLFGYSTVGRNIYDQFHDHRTNYFYKSFAQVDFNVSNPYVNAGLSQRASLATVYGGVYGMHIWTDEHVNNHVKGIVQTWEDYHIKKVVYGKSDTTDPRSGGWISDMDCNEWWLQ